MAEHHILSLPVYDDEKQRFIGLLDVHDIVSFFLSLVRTSQNPSLEFSKTTVNRVYSMHSLLPPLTSS
jgi:CBS domain containing-hemolysin-like protein